MKSLIISTTANSISSGGTISGDVTIDGDLTVIGDGGFNMNIQELQCINHNKIPIKIVINDAPTKA